MPRHTVSRSDSIASNDWMIVSNEFGMDVEASCRNLFEDGSSIFTEKLRNTKKDFGVWLSVLNG